MPTVDITPLVSTDRERFLRQNETAIRRAADEALKASRLPDPTIQSALLAIAYSEELHHRHSVAVTAMQATTRIQLAQEHECFAAKAMQLKLRALDQLHHLVL